MELTIDKCNWSPHEGHIAYKREGDSLFYFDVMRKAIVNPKNHNRGLEVCEYGGKNSIYKPIVATIPPLKLEGIPFVENLLNKQ